MIALAVLIAGVLAYFIAFSDRAPQGDKELSGLIDGFMKTLPDTTTAEQRTEIRGIMDRFYYQAIRGNVAADDVLAIEADFRSFAAKGGIPVEDLFPFMSKVGKATRREAGAGDKPAN
jgi:hypothetical protein